MEIPLCIIGDSIIKFSHNGDKREGSEAIVFVISLLDSKVVDKFNR